MTATKTLLFWGIFAIVIPTHAQLIDYSNTEQKTTNLPVYYTLPDSSTTITTNRSETSEVNSKLGDNSAYLDSQTQTSPNNPKTPTPSIKEGSPPKTPIKNSQHPDTKPTTIKKAPKEKIVPTVKNINLKFSSFPAKIYTGKRILPNINSLKRLNSFYGEALNDTGLKGGKGEKKFIQTLAKAKPNYAGHYVITSFACGLNCTASVAYDVRTGEFMELGGGFADCPATDFNPRQKAAITHQANSRLLIVIGATTTGNCIAGYFEEKNGNVSLISQKNLLTYVEAR